ncbi:NADPH-dependent FMN reductase [Nonomuraea polychroma]|uniref:NADPH-dependent FMN reductase n=1 Tax=Nonomuraea polychroma TaxID=46176 RepID=UPI003D943B91
MSTHPAPLRLAVIVGSARAERLAPQVVSWFTEQIAQRADMSVDVIDLLQARLPDSLDPQAPEVATLRPRLAGADGFVVVVPEYNHSFPGVVKTAIDCYTTEWHAKPVGFISYGLSRTGGARAVEHLRQVFAELHAVSVRNAVEFPAVLEHFGPDGRLPRESGSEAAAKVMLDQLAWWAWALRDAKSRRPYEAMR